MPSKRIFTKIIVKYHSLHHHCDDQEVELVIWDVDLTVIESGKWRMTDHQSTV